MSLLRSRAFNDWVEPIQLCKLTEDVLSSTRGITATYSHIQSSQHKIPESSVHGSSCLFLIHNLCLFLSVSFLLSVVSTHQLGCLERTEGSMRCSSDHTPVECSNSSKNHACFWQLSYTDGVRLFVSTLSTLSLSSASQIPITPSQATYLLARF